jgi:C4-dicarboxylate transporter DctQ subunit
MKIIDKIIQNISVFIASFGIMAGVFLSFVNVVARYGFDYSFTWAAELTIYLFLWSMFFAAVYCFKTNTHIAINFFVESMPKKVAKVLLIVSKFITIIFLSAVAYYGYEYLLLVIDMGENSIDLEIPMWIPYLIIPLSFGFSAYIVLKDLIKLVFTSSQNLKFKNEHDDIIKENSTQDIVKAVESKTAGML